MPKNNQRGVAHLFIILLLAVGLIVGLILISKPAIFNPRAGGGVSGPISGPIDGGLLPSPTVYWSFNESNGNYAYNSAAEGVSLVGEVNNAVFVPGQYNNALQFNGTSSYVVVRDNSALRFGTADVSISAWFKTTTTGVYQFIVSKGGFTEPNYPFYVIYIIPSNKVQFLVSDCGTGSCNQDVSRQPVISSSVVTDGQWHHVVGVRRSTGYELYLDGRLEATRTEPTTRNSDDYSEDLYIGNQKNQNYFNGLIDEVKIYNRALTAEQVVSDMNYILGPVPTSPSQSNLEQRVSSLEGQLVEAQRRQQSTQSQLDQLVAWIRSIFSIFR